MHECPDCGQACYCDLDDSNDCRDRGVCYHRCAPEDDDLDYGSDDEPEAERGGEGDGTAKGRP